MTSSDARYIQYMRDKHCAGALLFSKYPTDWYPAEDDNSNMAIFWRQYCGVTAENLDDIEEPDPEDLVDLRPYEGLSLFEYYSSRNLEGNITTEDIPNHIEIPYDPWSHMPLPSTRSNQYRIDRYNELERKAKKFLEDYPHLEQ